MMDNMEYGSLFFYLFLRTRFIFTDRALNATQKTSQSDSFFNNDAFRNVTL